MSSYPLFIHVAFPERRLHLECLRDTVMKDVRHSMFYSGLLPLPVAPTQLNPNFETVPYIATAFGKGRRRDTTATLVFKVIEKLRYSGFRCLVKQMPIVRWSPEAKG
jgi:hypothetical protein